MDALVLKMRLSISLSHKSIMHRLLPIAPSRMVINMQIIQMVLNNRILLQHLASLFKQLLPTIITSIQSLILEYYLVVSRL
jgi:hypothetical protein